MPRLVRSLWVVMPTCSRSGSALWKELCEAYAKEGNLAKVKEYLEIMPAPWLRFSNLVRSGRAMVPPLSCRGAWENGEQWCSAGF